MTAYCDDSPSCPDVCEPDEYKCATELPEELTYMKAGTIGSKYRKKCIFKDSPIPGNIGRKCYGWAEPSDGADNYDFCGMSAQCIDGQCVPFDDMCSLGESHCEDANDKEYVVPCDVIKNINQWSWGNRTLCRYGCNETFNSTTNKRIATCMNATTFHRSITDMRNSFHEYEEWWNILWKDPVSKMFITLILMVTTFIILYQGGWQVSLAGSMIVLLGTVATGWVGMAIIFGLMLVVGIIVLPKYLKGAKS